MGSLSLGDDKAVEGRHPRKLGSDGAAQRVCSAVRLVLTSASDVRECRPESGIFSRAADVEFKNVQGCKCGQGSPRDSGTAEVETDEDTAADSKSSDVSEACVETEVNSAQEEQFIKASGVVQVVSAGIAVHEARTDLSQSLERVCQYSPRLSDAVFEAAPSFDVRKSHMRRSSA